MIFIAFVLSLFVVAVSIFDPAYSDFLLLAGPCAVASLWIIVLKSRQAGRADRAKRPAKPYVIIDGSNVMHWADGLPSLEPVTKVIRMVEDRGMIPAIIFDANAGYKLSDRYLDGRAFAGKLNLTLRQVSVVPKGTPADLHILETARLRRAKVITADRYRDWAESFPEVVEPGFLIRGGVKEGQVWLADGLSPAPLRTTPLAGPARR